MSQQHIDPTPTTALARPADAGGSPDALFAAQAARTPTATALVGGQQRVSYAELDGWINRLVRHLADRGVRPGGLVAIHLERNPHLVATLLAVLRAGAGHTLLDPCSPAERLEAVLAGTAPCVLITQTHLPPLRTAAVTVDLTRDTAAICALPAVPAAPAIHPGTAAPATLDTPSLELLAPLLHGDPVVLRPPDHPRVLPATYPPAFHRPPMA